jgi:hypothetical protein
MQIRHLAESAKFPLTLPRILCPLLMSVNGASATQVETAAQTYRLLMDVLFDFCAGFATGPMENAERPPTR